MMSGDAAPLLVACHDCGKLHGVPPTDSRNDFHCTRCNADLGNFDADLTPSLALYLAALMTFVLANCLPIMSMTLEGRTQECSLLSASWALWRADMHFLGGLVFFTGTLAPALKIGSMLYVLIPMRFGGRLPFTSHVFRIGASTAPWAMMEVYLLGIIVAYVKMSELAHISVSLAMFAYAATVLLEVAGQGKLEPMTVWHRLSPQADARIRPGPGETLLTCHTCQQVMTGPLHEGRLACPRCGSGVHADDPDAWKTSLAFLVAAIVLYVPANLLPVMTVVYFGSGEPSTIMSGVIELWQAHMYPIAILVFIASITVPVLKILALLWLIFARAGDYRTAREKARIYRIVEFVGRWSMVDIFMVGILAALVQLGAIATILPGTGGMAFAAVVILTILASSAFNPRSVWPSSIGRAP